MTKFNSVDIMHFYLNSPFRFIYNDGTTFFSYVESVNSDKDMMFGDSYFIEENGKIRKPLNSEDGWFEILDLCKEGKFELILHHPCDISKEMMATYRKLCYKIVDLHDSQKVVRYSDTPLSMKYMFDNSIDAFELIENGYALDWKDFDFITKKPNKKV